MPTLYETKWLRRHFGWKSTNNPKSSGDSFVYGSLRADTQDIDKVMREIVSELGNEWQIKSAVPLVASAYTKSTVGMPWSMENTFTDGILIICQHSYEISEEELAIRKKAESEKKRVDAGQEEREIVRWRYCVNQLKPEEQCLGGQNIYGEAWNLIRI
jgi:hypothetical protein